MSARENGELTMADKNENGSAFDLLGQFDIAPIKAVKDTPFEFITNSAFFMMLTVAVIAVLTAVVLRAGIVVRCFVVGGFGFVILASHHA